MKKLLFLTALVTVQLTEAHTAKFRPFLGAAALAACGINDQLAKADAEFSLSKDCGHAEMQGKRQTMEDAYDIRCEGDFCLYGVYDGHGGAEIAQKYVAPALNKTIIENIKEGKGYSKALFDSYLQVDKNLPAELSQGQGTTAVTVLVSEEQIVVANTGDSRAVLCSNGKAEALSEDHKPDRQDEFKRIQAAGGQVSFWGCYRVNGILALSRALGDHALSPSVIPDPDIQTHARSVQDQFLILACDGVWDVLDNQQAVDIVNKKLQRGYTTQEAAKELIQSAYKNGSTDNISAIVVDLRKDKTVSWKHCLLDKVGA